MHTRFTRFLVGTTVALSLFGGASLAQASDLTASQISSILNLLSSFGASQEVINNVSAALNGQATSGTGQKCVDLSRTLTLGSTGNDVTNLQNYLIQKGYLSANATGYYGFKTAQAVGQLQLDLSILSSQSDPSYGIMGPRTRSAIACSATSNTPTLRIVSPDGGESFRLDQPMTITWSANNIPSWSNFVVQFERLDGDQRQLAVAVPSSNSLTRSYTIPSLGEFSKEASEGTRLALVAGTYKISMWNGDVTDSLSVRDTTDGIITITAPSSAPTATIDPSSLTQKAGTFSITGSTSENRTGIIVFISTYDYGSPSYATLHSQIGKDSIYEARSSVVNGRWSAQFSFNLPANFKVWVYDADAKGDLLTTG